MCPRRRWRTWRPAIPKTKPARLERFQSYHPHRHLTMSPINLKESIWARVRSECSAEIAACSVAIKKHRELLDEYSRRSMMPGQAGAMVKYLSERALEDPNPERLQAHANILAGLQAVAQNQSVQFEACRAVNKLYIAVEGPVLALVQAATDS